MSVFHMSQQQGFVVVFHSLIIPCFLVLTPPPSYNSHVDNLLSPVMSPLDSKLAQQAHQGNLAGVQELYSQGANIDASCIVSGGVLTCALAGAAANGLLPMVNWLLANGATVDLRTSHGATALELAAKRGRSEVIRSLLAASADPHALGSRDLRVIDICRNTASPSDMKQLDEAVGRLQATSDQVELDEHTAPAHAKSPRNHRV
jgi:hypothetical protein